MNFNIVTMLWDANQKSHDFSRCYDESWVKKLYDGVVRNLSKPFQFVLFTDRRRDLGSRDILQIMIDQKNPGYGAYVEPYRLDEPMILMGLDTIITGSIDHLAEYCLTRTTLALPNDPFHPAVVCNGVALVPAGQRGVFERWDGSQNDMVWMRQQKYKVIDTLFPGQVVSYKGHVKGYGLRDARIVFFHGHEKPHELPDVEWIKQHWYVDESLERVEDVPPEGFVCSTEQEIHALPNTASEIIFRNIEINSRRKLPWLKERTASDGVAVICGGGPSLKLSMPLLRAHREAGHQIFALNNAANFLADNGAVPDVQMVIDPRPENVNFVSEASALRFILASQCDPLLFDALAGCDVTVLHPAIEGIRDHIPEGATATLVGGGVTCGLTALAAVHTLGYREMHLYGYDSSDADNGNAHAYAQTENDKERRRIEVICAGRKFRASYAMYKQAELFPNFALMLADAGTQIYVHGDGLLPTIAREMTKSEAAEKADGIQAN